MKDFGKRLKELREERDLTMDMLVLDVNQQFGIKIHKSNLSRWEKGIVDPTLQYAVYLAKYFNVSLDYMIGLTDNKAPARLIASSKGLK